MSPAILRIRNLRFFIYPKDHDPPHVHVKDPDGNEAKFRISDGSCYFNRGFSKKTVTEVSEIIQERIKLLMELWYEWQQ